MFRLLKTMDQTELALRTGLSRASISALGRGKEGEFQCAVCRVEFFATDRCDSGGSGTAAGTVKCDPKPQTS